MSNYKEKAVDILNDKASSDWIRKAVIALDKRDVVDALNDIEALQQLLTLKFEEAMNAWKQPKAVA